MSSSYPPCFLRFEIPTGLDVRRALKRMEALASALDVGCVTNASGIEVWMWPGSTAENAWDLARAQINLGAAGKKYAGGVYVRPQEQLP